jgi:hypothetical protein
MASYLEEFMAGAHSEAVLLDRAALTGNAP